MKKVNKKKGFTLAELLVVIAILAILIAIAVPIFTGTLDKAQETVEDANFRAAESAAMVKYLTDGESGTVKYSYTVDPDDGKLSVAEADASATVGKDATDPVHKGVVEVGG